MTSILPHPANSDLASCFLRAPLLAPLDAHPLMVYGLRSSLRSMLTR